MIYEGNVYGICNNEHVIRFSMVSQKKKKDFLINYAYKLQNNELLTSLFIFLKNMCITIFC